MVRWEPETLQGRALDYDNLFVKTNRFLNEAALQPSGSMPGEDDEFKWETDSAQALRFPLYRMIWK